MYFGAMPRSTLPSSPGLFRSLSFCFAMLSAFLYKR